MLIKKPLQTIDGIDCFLQDVPSDYQNYDAQGLEKHLEVEKKHFWFISRRENILSAVTKHLQHNSRFLEIGAGTAYVAKGVMNLAYDVSVGEIHLSGLKYAKEKGIKHCYQFDLFDPPFENEFDAIGLFDVIEHFDEDIEALKQSTRMLKQEGKIFITVPAHQWLWSRADAVASHKRRYTKKQLIQRVEQAGLIVDEVHYFFIFILPLLYLRKLLSPDHGQNISEKELKQGMHINPLLNNLLLILTKLEHRLFKWLPNVAGGSLLLVARKK